MAHNLSGGIVDLRLAETVTKKLIDASLDKWKKKGMNADNLSVITIIISDEEVAEGTIQVLRIN